MTMDGPAPPRADDRLDRELARLPQPIWDHVFRLCAERIRSRGDVSGAVKLSDPAVIRAVEGMGCAVQAGRVGLKDLDRAMRHGRLIDGLLAATERWIGMAIVTKRDERALQQQAWAVLYDGWRAAIHQSLAILADEADVQSRLDAWLKRATPYIKGRWRKHPATIDRSVRRAIEAARRAPGVGPSADVVPLPVFAQQIAGHPHALDSNRTAGRLAIAALRARFRDTVGQVEGYGAEARAAILDAAGLSTDGVSSRMVTFGLGGPHPLFAAAIAMREPLTLTAFNLEHMDVVTAPSGVVCVVENPAVFTHVVRAVVAKQRSADGEDQSEHARWPSIVCTSGQFGVTAAMLLDRLNRSGATIWYSGDFDRSGLYMADRVMRRFPGQCLPWRMLLRDYQDARQNGPTDRDDLEPASHLLAVAHWPAHRIALAEAVRRTGPAFQEALVEALAADVMQRPMRD